MLSSFGAQQIEMASNAEDALEKCRYDFYDVIICDFNLGPGKNGQQILEELRYRKRLRHTHLFIMITAETAKDVVLGAREYQPDAYIAKPITRTVLEQRLGQLLLQQKALKGINREIDLANYPKAITLCHQKIDEKTRHQSWCYQTLGSLYIKTGDLQSAESIYRNALATRELPWARIGLGQVLLLQQKYQLAQQCFEQAIGHNPNLVEAYDGLSDTFLKQGQSKAAQTMLEQAVALSPRMVTRQEKLGGLSLTNNDLEHAALAYKMAAQYAENSVYDKPDYLLSLGKCLAEWSEGDLSEAGRQRAQEAIAALDRAVDRFSSDENACLCAMLIQARVHAGQGEQTTAEELLYKFECSQDEEAKLTPTTYLEFARTLYSLGHRQRAEELLIEMSARYAKQADILSQIESLMDEPEGVEARVRAKELNRSGITLFEQGRLEEAVDAFRAALNHTPRHAALNLNLVQVALKLFKDSQQHEHLKIARDALDQVRHIPTQHQQYKRLHHLIAQVEKHTQHSELTRAPDTGAASPGDA